MLRDYELTQLTIAFRYSRDRLYYVLLTLVAFSGKICDGIGPFPGWYVVYAALMSMTLRSRSRKICTLVVNDSSEERSDASDNDSDHL